LSARSLGERQPQLPEHFPSWIALRKRDVRQVAAGMFEATPDRIRQQGNDRIG
jgi:hypothetical protein